MSTYYNTNRLMDVTQNTTPNHDKTHVVTPSLTRGHLSSCFGDSTHMCSSLAKTNGFKH